MGSVNKECYVLLLKLITTNYLMFNYFLIFIVILTDSFLFKSIYILEFSNKLIMGKKKIDVCGLIKNLNKRTVTYSKRKRGLLKKAIELSVMCD